MRAVGIIAFVGACSAFLDEAPGEPSPGAPQCLELAVDTSSVFCFRPADGFVADGIEIELGFDPPPEVLDDGVRFAGELRGVGDASELIGAGCLNSGLTIEVVAATAGQQIFILGEPRRLFELRVGTQSSSHTVVIGTDRVGQELVIRTPDLECTGETCESNYGTVIQPDQFHHIALVLTRQSVSVFLDGASIGRQTGDTAATIDDWPGALGGFELAVGNVLIADPALPNEPDFRRFWSGTLNSLAISCDAFDAETIASRANQALGR